MTQGTTVQPVCMHASARAARALGPRAAAILASSMGLILASQPAAAQSGQSAAATPAVRAQDADWRAHHNSPAGHRYSPLDQIHAGNVGALRQAWAWESGSVLGEDSEYRNQSTPLAIDGVLYFTLGPRRAVVATDGATGQTLWTWELDEGARARSAPRPNSGRGVAYWSDGDDARILVVTPAYHLVALDAATGQPVAGFGQDGVVDLKLAMGVELDPETAVIGSSSPPVVFEDFVILGPALAVGLAPPSMKNVPGYVMAFDARTGAVRWRFHTIPRPGEFGVETWERDAWEYTGNAGVWAPMSVDVDRGMVYLPVEAATGDYYGGHRPGDNLFSTSLVALDARTGDRVWHQQIIRHDIWDRDNPTAPILADVTVDGRAVPAVVQLTKQAFAYVYDRVTGAPVWPIEDRPVPASDVPGERASPTQPFPTKPAPYDRQGVTVDDLVDFTPELRAAAVEAVKPFRLGSLYSPASLRGTADSTQGTLSLPGTLGGTNWEGGAFDPATGMLYVGSYTNPSVLALREPGQRSDMNYIFQGGRVPSVDGLPLVKPPYSRITAIDLHSGEHAWMIAAGNTPAAIREHPALAGVDLPRTGSDARPVMLVTATLLFTGEGTGGEPYLRAHDKATGRILWELELPAPVTSPPMSYAVDGRQHLAFWIGDARLDVPSRLVSLALPGS